MIHHRIASLCLMREFKSIIIFPVIARLYFKSEKDKMDAVNMKQNPLYLKGKSYMSEQNYDNAAESFSEILKEW